MFLFTDSGAPRHLHSAPPRRRPGRGLSADDEYEYDDGVEMAATTGARQSDAKRERHNKSVHASTDRKAYSATERAEQRFSKHKALIRSEEEGGQERGGGVRRRLGDGGGRDGAQRAEANWAAQRELR